MKTPGHAAAVAATRQAAAHPQPNDACAPRGAVHDALQQSPVLVAQRASLGALIGAGPVVQARILKPIATNPNWVQRDTLGPGVAEKIKQWMYGPVAAHPNVTLAALFQSMDDQGLNPQQGVKLGLLKAQFGNLLDSLEGWSLARAQAEWKDLDDQVEKFYMQVFADRVNKPMKVDPGQSARLNQAALGETTEPWRQRGKYGGIKSRIPASGQHYVVGSGTQDKPGAERVYTKNIKLADETPALEAYYSSTHGDSKAKDAKESRVFSANPIGGKEAIAPWDPRQKQAD